MAGVRVVRVICSKTFMTFSVGFFLRLFCKTILFPAVRPARERDGQKTARLMRRIKVGRTTETTMETTTAAMP